MSLTSYRAAPPRVTSGFVGLFVDVWVMVFGRPGGDRLSRVLGRSIIGAGVFHGRVRDGIGCRHPAKATRSSKDHNPRSEVGRAASDVCLLVLVIECASPGV